MTTDGTEYLIRCFAYNKAGQRCEQLAGHDGDHALVTSWSDEDCWVPTTPTQFSAPTPVLETATGYVALHDDGVEDVTEHLVDIPKSSGKCVICGHRMHNGGCTKMDGEFPCDCANGVEA